MAQAGYTPLSLYYSTTAAAAPTSGNLVNGELAINIQDEKLYFKNAAGTVKQIAGTGVGGITYTAVKTTTYTAVANDGVLTNTTGGAFTVNLPATPATGTQVFIADSAGTWATNNLTIGRNGSTIAGSATDLVCDINSVSIQCIYDGTTWDIFAQIGANDTAVVTLNGTQTLTNKTLTAPVLTAPVLGTPASGTVTNLTGTASININGTVGATTPSTGAFTTLSATGNGTIATLTGTGVTSYLKMTNTGQTAANGFQVQTVNEDVYVVNYSTSGNIFFSTNGSANNDMTINAAGGVQHINSISVGNATPSVSGAGITFPATQDPSSNANTLDDYEEGTWTPSVGGTATYLSQQGSYTKIGNFVKLRFNLEINVIGTGSAVAITGIPFNPANVVPTIIGGNVCYVANLATSVLALGLYIQSTGVIYFYTRNSVGTATTTQQPAIMGNSFIVYGEVSYQV